MNNEEFERKMNFIVEQQAQYAFDMDKHLAWHAENDRKHQIWKAEIEDLLTRLARVTNEGFKDTNAKINALIDAQIRTDEQLRINAEQQRKTDELLRRHLGEKRNGQDSN